MRPLSIALVALAVTCVSIAVTAAALNAIAFSQSAELQRNNLTHGSTATLRGNASHYGVGHVAMPKGQKVFPAELLPVD